MPSNDAASGAPAGGEPDEPQRHDLYEQAPRHDPAFPSWRYAGLRWLADRLYGDGRSSKG